MIAVRVVVGVLAVVGIAAVLASMLRTVVLPRGVPARLARIAFLAVYWLLRFRLRLTGRSDYATRDRIFAVEAPLGLFAQLTTWAVLIWLLFAAVFWSLTTDTVDGSAIARALELSGSSRRSAIRSGPALQQLGARSVRSAGGGVGQLGRLVYRGRRIPYHLSTTQFLPLAPLGQPLGARLGGRAGRRRARDHGLRYTATVPRRVMPTRRDPRIDLDRRFSRHSPPPAGTRCGDHAL